ncbi:MAG: prolyl oligopeptidase family serine peptidase, partial [Acidobacteriota bacterium]
GAARPAGCPGGAPAPPPTAVRPVVDTIHGESFTDPYRWLEDQEHADVRRWIDAQNQYADAVLARTPIDPAIRTRLTALMQSPDVGRPQRGGDFEYFTLRRAGEDLAAIYRRPAAEAPPRIDPAGTYERVIDPRPLSPDLTVSVDLLAVAPDGARLIYSIRDGGQDERVLAVRDLASGADTERFPNALYDSVSLRTDGTGFYYVVRSRETGARVRSHGWGDPPERDAVLFGEGYGPTAFISMAQDEEGKRLLYTVQHGWARSEVWLQDAAAGTPPAPVVHDVDAHFFPRFVDGELWMRTDFEAPMGRVVAVDASAPGARDRWRTVLAETGQALEDFARIDERIYATYVTEKGNRILVYGTDGRPRGEVEVPPFSTASIRGDGKGQALLTLQSFTTPTTVYRLHLSAGTRAVEEPPEVSWNAEGIATELIYGTSRDGTRVPVFVVGREGRARDGSGRVLLGGYGGFNVAQKPRFSAQAALWVERGGVYAYALLRGGSEFGETWHRGGMLTNKQNVFDDFIAAAEALVGTGETRPGRLAITGTSNGGLLVGAVLTQRPELLGAVLCGFPDVDILRFNQFTRANNMPALLEYGDAAIREQFDAIRRFSPYQQVRAGTPYPAVMIWSGDLDTRVPPLAARKFAAALQAATSSAHPVILRYHPRAGHAAGNGLPLSARITLQAEQLHFLDQALDDEEPR